MLILVFNCFEMVKVLAGPHYEAQEISKSGRVRHRAPATVTALLLTVYFSHRHYLNSGAEVHMPLVSFAMQVADLQILKVEDVDSLVRKFTEEARGQRDVPQCLCKLRCARLTRPCSYRQAAVPDWRRLWPPFSSQNTPALLGYVCVCAIIGKTIWEVAFKRG